MRYIRLSVVFLLAACGDGETTPTSPPTPVATSITLSATSLSFSSVGATQQLTATVKDQNGTTMSGASVSWAVTGAAATVSSAGLVTAVAVGTATITATSGSASATASVTVTVTQSFLQFDGVNDYVKIPHSDVLNLTTYTVSAWFKADDPTAPGYIIARGESFDTDQMQYSLSVSGWPAAREYLGAWFEDSGANSSDDNFLTSTSKINAGQWYFGVVTRSTNGDYRLYIDGNLEASSTGTSAPETITHFNAIGVRTNSLDKYEEYFDGAIKEAAIWDTALSAAQITALYNSGTPIDASNNSGNYISSSSLKGYWRLNESTGSTASDLSGNGNDGTIHGATWGEGPGQVADRTSQRSSQNTGRNQ